MSEWFSRELFLREARGNQNKADLLYVEAILERGHSEIEARTRIITERTNWDAIGDLEIGEYIKGVIREAKKVLASKS